jgi:hypothetical protein
MFASFWIHLLISVTEFVAWIFYLNGDNVWFGWYVDSIGWWGSIFLLPIPWLFSVCQIALTADYGGLAGQMTLEYSFNAVFMTVTGLLAWVQASAMHVLLNDRLQCHIQANPPRQKKKRVKCPLKRKEGQSNAEY